MVYPESQEDAVHGVNQGKLVSKVNLVLLADPGHKVFKVILVLSAILVHKVQSDVKALLVHLD